MTQMQEKTRDFDFDEAKNTFVAGDFVFYTDDEDDARREYALRTYLNDWDNPISHYFGDLCIDGQDYAVCSDSKLDQMINDAVWYKTLKQLEYDDPDMFMALDDVAYVDRLIKRHGHGALLGKKVTEGVFGFWIVEGLPT